LLTGRADPCRLAARIGFWPFESWRPGGRLGQRIAVRHGLRPLQGARILNASGKGRLRLKLEPDSVNAGSRRPQPFEFAGSISGPQVCHKRRCLPFDGNVLMMLGFHPQQRQICTSWGKITPVRAGLPARAARVEHSFTATPSW